MRYKIFKKGQLITRSFGKHRISYFDQLSGCTNLKDESNWIMSHNIAKHIKTKYKLNLCDYKALCEFGSLNKTFKCECCGRIKKYKHYFNRIALDWNNNCNYCCTHNISKIRSNTFSNIWKTQHETMSRHIGETNKKTKQ